MYPRCLPYLNSMSAGTLRAGTTYSRTMFIGSPNISRPRNRPRMFATTASAKMANRSSASKPKNVTRVRRFRYTGVTSRAISCVLLLNSCRSLRDEELGEPHESRQEQAKSRDDEMPHPTFGGMDPCGDAHA